MVARQEFCKKNDVAPEEVGCFFITPCAAKMTAIRNPIGHETSAVDGAISMMEIYGLLAGQLKSIPADTHIAVSRFCHSGKTVFGYALTLLLFSIAPLRFSYTFITLARQHRLRLRTNNE